MEGAKLMVDVAIKAATDDDASKDTMIARCNHTHTHTHTQGFQVKNEKLSPVREDDVVE